MPISRWRTAVRLNKIDGQTAGAKDHDLAQRRSMWRTDDARTVVSLKILGAWWIDPGDVRRDTNVCANARESTFEAGGQVTGCWQQQGVVESLALTVTHKLTRLSSSRVTCSLE